MKEEEYTFLLAERIAGFHDELKKLGLYIEDKKEFTIQCKTPRSKKSLEVVAKNSITLYEKMGLIVESAAIINFLVEYYDTFYPGQDNLNVDSDIIQRVKDKGDYVKKLLIEPFIKQKKAVLRALENLQS